MQISICLSFGNWLLDCSDRLTTSRKTLKKKESYKSETGGHVEVEECKLSVDFHISTLDSIIL